MQFKLFISKTAPYFRDSLVAKVKDASRIMAQVQLGRTPSPADACDIAAFFESLTGDISAHYAPPAQPITAK